MLGLTHQRAKRERLAGWTALLLYGVPTDNAATISLVHALVIFRHRCSSGVFFLFALFAMAAFILVVIVKLKLPSAARLLTAVSGSSQSESWKK